MKLLEIVSNTKIYDFTEVINWFEKGRKEEPTTKNIADNVKRQLELYNAFADIYVLECEDEESANGKNDAAETMLTAYKKIIYLNQRAHGILNPKIKFSPLKQQLDEFFRDNPKIKNFIFKYLK